MSKPRAVLVSSHFVRSTRRAGFHFIADALARMGWHVTFVTAGFSHLSRLKSDHRFGYGLVRRANRVEALEPDLDSYVWFTPYHPLNRLPKAANVLMEPLFRGYSRLPMPDLQPVVAAADLVIFESTSGLMLVDRFRAWNPAARFVYRVSDDLRLLRAHPVVVRAESAALDEFALISVPSESIRHVFASRPNVVLQHHGINTAAFDAPSVNPYAGLDSTHAIFVGVSHLDRDFLAIASELFPDWRFHVIGPLLSVPRAANVITYGELPFPETVPFITHADVGLAIRSYAPGAESLSDSLKVIQYTYARLPVVAPEFMKSSRTNFFPYRPGDPASIRAALAGARAFDRSTVDRSGIGSWDDLARQLAGPLAGDERAG